VEVACPAGCRKCNLGHNNMLVCTDYIDGFGLDTNGEIIRCNSLCMTCAASDANICTSCFFGFILSGTTCVRCSDPNAVSCSSASWSILCR